MTTASPSRNPSDAAFFEGLRPLLADCGSNQHDRAFVLIIACITDGRDTLPSIMSAAKYLGLNTRHVALILTREAGHDPQRHWWHRSHDGRYSLLEEAQSAA